MKQESVDTDESDSNKLEDIIDTSLTVKSEVTGDDDDDNDEKQDTEKDVEESDADLLQNDGDIKLEDLEELNGVEENKEVGLVINRPHVHILSIARLALACKGWNNSKITFTTINLTQCCDKKNYKPWLVSK